MHKAESRTLPIGRHRKYPAVIPWDDIWRTLEIPWIRQRVKRITEDPRSSELFLDRLAVLAKPKGSGSLKEAMVFAAAPG